MEVGCDPQHASAEQELPYPSALGFTRGPTQGLCPREGQFLSLFSSGTAWASFSLLIIQNLGSLSDPFLKTKASRASSQKALAT